MKEDKFNSMDTLINLNNVIVNAILEIEKNGGSDNIMFTEIKIQFTNKSDTITLRIPYQYIYIALKKYVNANNTSYINLIKKLESL